MLKDFVIGVFFFWYDYSMDLKIVDDLKELLEQDSTIHAMWIAGSVAEGTADELSDVDLWLDIDDGKDQLVLDTIEKFLDSKGTKDLNFSEGVTPPFTHTVYHLSHMNPLHFIEINLHTHSHPFGLFDSLRKIKVLFDKDGTTKFKTLDETEYNKMLKERRQFLLEKIVLGEVSVRKELTRHNFPNAMHNYLFWLVEPVIELARIKLSPLKITYNLKHASRDLPKDTVSEIESLYTVASLDDLNKKIDEIKIMTAKYK
jgi:predicted nucleotidyltransferase